MTTLPKGRVFLDTNILIYADDLDAGEKRERAQALLREALTSGKGVISTQVLQEFFVVATKKLNVPPALAQEKVRLLARLDVVLVRPELIVSAIDLYRLHSLSFWDALIVKSAAVAGCTSLFSEDLADGTRLDGVRIENPLR